MKTRPAKITGLRIANFKAFAAEQQIPIRPITLLVGPNSGGKSSVIHAVLAMNEIRWTMNVDISRTAMGGESVNLGGFYSYANKSSHNSAVSFGFDVSVGHGSSEPHDQSWRSSGGSNIIVRALVGITKLGTYKTDDVIFPKEDGSEPTVVPGIEVPNSRLAYPDAPMIGLTFKERPNAEPGRPEPELLALHLSLNELPFACFSIHPGEFSSLFFNLRHPEINPEIQSICSDSGAVDDLGLWLGADWGFTNATFLGLEASRLSALRALSKAPESENSFFPFILEVTKYETGQIFSSVPFPMRETLNFASAELERWLTQIVYVGPLRDGNMVLGSSPTETVERGGRAVWSELFRDEELRRKVSNWLTLPDHLCSPYALILRRWRMELPDRILSEQSLSSKAPFVKDDLALLDVNRGIFIEPSQVGTGISQVLPVLCAFYGCSDRAILIEQPELHLHPALQAELGDAAIEAALGERRNTMILETHSEHMILRILRRIRETTHKRLPDGAPPVRPDDVSIVFISSTSEGATARRLEVNENGEFLSPWPEGFFADRLSELL